MSNFAIFKEICIRCVAPKIMFGVEVVCFSFGISGRQSFSNVENKFKTTEYFGIRINPTSSHSK